MSEITTDFLEMKFSKDIATRLRMGRHITAANGEAFAELLGNEATYRAIFDKMGYSLLSGAGPAAKHVEYFYFGSFDGAEVKSDTQKKMIALYCAIRVHLQNVYASATQGYGSQLIRILNGEASFGADVAQAIMNTHELRLRLARHDITSLNDVERVLAHMVYYGFFSKDESSGSYTMLASVFRIEQEFAVVEERLKVFSANKADEQQAA